MANGGSSTGGASGGSDAGGGTGGATAGSDAGAATFTNRAPGSELFLGGNFWNEGWEPTSDYFAAGVDWSTTTNPWNPALLADLAPYAKVLRFMDWNRTNDQVDGAWATRAQPDVQPGSRGVAYEWQIDLCNRTHTDYWINVPTLATDDHVTKLAQLIEQKLDSDLRVYVEYSNEVWNGGFPQSNYAIAQGQALGLPGMNQWYQGWAWYVYRSVRVFEGFEAVFGKDSPRLVKVLAGQSGWLGDPQTPAPVCAWHFEMLADATVNPNGTSVDAYAIAPYFSGSSISALSSQIQTSGVVAGGSANSTMQGVVNHAACAQDNGVDLIGYEGGQDSFAAPSCQDVQTDPGMRNLYSEYLDALATSGMKGPFMQYTHVGTCWGLKVATGDADSAAPKYQGVLDWLAAQP